MDFSYLPYDIDGKTNFMFCVNDQFKAHFNYNHVSHSIACVLFGFMFSLASVAAHLVSWRSGVVVESEKKNYKYDGINN